MNIYSHFKDFYDYVNPPNKEDKVFHRKTFICTIPSKTGMIGKKEIDIHRVKWNFDSITSTEQKEKVTYFLNIELSKYLMDLINDTKFAIRRHIGRYDSEVYYQWYLCLCGVMYHFVQHRNSVWMFEDAPKEVLDKVTSLFGNMPEIDWITNYQTNSKTVELHRVFNTPMFTISSTYNHMVDITLNPCLLRLGLNKLLDKVKVHQDIDMFLNNVLVKQDDPNIVMSEADKLASKGMDKWSFKQVGPKDRKK